MVVPVHNGLYIVFGASELDVLDKRGAVRARWASIPFQNIAPSRVIISKCIREGIVRASVARQQLS